MVRKHNEVEWESSRKELIRKIKIMNTYNKMKLSVYDGILFLYVYYKNL